MALQVFNANEARLKWRDIVDAASTGETITVIERYHKPVAVVISVRELQGYLGGA